jgi:hypothetical protein
VGGSVMDNKNKQVIFEVMLDWVYGQDLSIMINDSENNPVLKNPGQWNSLKNCVQVIIDKKELNLKL